MSTSVLRVVGRGRAAIRICLTATHSFEEIAALCDLLGQLPEKGELAVA